MRKQTFFNLLMLFVMSIVSLNSWAEETDANVVAYNAAKAKYSFTWESIPQNIQKWLQSDYYVKSGNEYWTGQTGTYYEQTDNEWSRTEWSHSASQTVTLVKGKYMMSIACRASSNVTSTMSVKVGNNDAISVALANKGNTGRGIDKNGNACTTDDAEYANNNLGYGWEYRFIEFEVAEEQTVTISLTSSTAGTKQWVSLAMPQLFSTVMEVPTPNTEMTNGYKAPYWNDYSIGWATPDGTFGDSYDDTWELKDSQTSFRRRLYGTNSSALFAVVNVDELSTFVYSTSGSSNDDAVIKVYVDDKLVRTLQGRQKSDYPTSKTYARFAEVLQPGKHTIKWVASTTETNATYYNDFNIINIGVIKSPLITVSLLEPGSLGTEVLYNTDHIKNVRRLKVKGKMNDDDWAKIKMMSGLLDLDLSEAKFTEIPEKQFQVLDNDTAMQFLHRLVLPEGLKKINDYAFYNSFIDTLSLPSTLTTIGLEAFRSSHIQEINMPDNCIDIYGGESHNDYPVFGSMYWMKKFVCAKNWAIIPASTFSDDCWLEDITLPEKLETIGNFAFGYCERMNVNFPEGLKKINQQAFYNCYYANFGAFPESLESIGSYSFTNCYSLESVTLPKNVSYIDQNIFDGCSNLKTAELGVNIWYATNNILASCNSLTTLRLNCPTVVGLTSNSNYYPVDADKIANVDLIVPSFLVNAYKLDKYWYNFKSITGFNTSEIQDWTINNPLVLNHDRFDGTPNITINGNYGRTPYLKFNGTNAQNIKNLTIDGSYNTSSYNGKTSSVIYYNNYPGQIYSNNTSNNISISGDVQVNLWAPSKTWEFFSLPFDCKIADITFGADNVQYAIRYYDGANRASVGATGSWKNYDKTSATIPAGTGFIIQTNKDTWCYFKAVDNDMKQNIVSYKEFSKTLAVNDCETASNKGWNLIGNPYQCFYNDHSLNFTAPITVWNNYNKNYVAYSLTDDDYAIRPNEAFFVQCPNAEYNTITFPLQGRQFTDVIESQNAAKGAAPSVNTRKLVNITMSNGEQSDQTRIVLNENAKLDYEMNCDASKFASMDNSVPQLFTIYNGTQYAINERPVADGKVQLGFYAAKTGSYTISLNRCDAEHVYLVDNETAETTDITNGEYTFTAKAGNNTSRFVIVFNAGETTGISSLTPALSQGEGALIYNLAGQRVQNAHKGIVIVNGKKVIK